jgi:hypothetical protein
MMKTMKGLLVATACLLIALPFSGALAEESTQAPMIGITGSSPLDNNLTVLPPSSNVTEESLRPAVPPQSIPDPSAPSVQFTPPQNSPSSPDQPGDDATGIPMPFDPSAAGFQEASENLLNQQTQETTLPVRPAQGFFSSAWFLLFLIALMISAYLIYVAFTEGRWPLQKASEANTKKTKKHKK